MDHHIQACCTCHNGPPYSGLLYLPQWTTIFKLAIPATMDHNIQACCTCHNGPPYSGLLYLPQWTTIFRLAIPATMDHHNQTYLPQWTTIFRLVAFVTMDHIYPCYTCHDGPSYSGLLYQPQWTTVIRIAIPATMDHHIQACCICHNGPPYSGLLYLPQWTTISRLAVPATIFRFEVPATVSHLIQTCYMNSNSNKRHELLCYNQALHHPIPSFPPHLPSISIPSDLSCDQFLYKGRQGFGVWVFYCEIEGCVLALISCTALMLDVVFLSVVLTESFFCGCDVFLYLL